MSTGPAAVFCCRFFKLAVGGDESIAAGRQSFATLFIVAGALSAWLVAALSIIDA